MEDIEDRLSLSCRQLFRSAYRLSEWSVSQVAYIWGFINLGEFARVYRNRFGEFASQTLRR
ncbi:helix-turn-helix domain-containing protein [Rhizobium sp. S95]|uniref:Helix-turn-helix domain-containing protein n=1 Tax=Ciceribacter sichuanensis TaxID=2949647 RepID=A0AAJ1C1R2_9HYPH|nr:MULTISPECIES: helix-turn-helix domain-containing protein [unclassified Ciceribacter]MCM2396046.1 helix-turn-helix domain-containing protein [Ciceribacter sp. S95]MCO5960194.1 helix-turn-helix domain-containing protein [Ciceribacter sp. S101]